MLRRCGDAAMTQNGGYCCERGDAIIPNVKIAVVEDDQPTREFVSNVLMYCVNREVLRFPNGVDAWQYIESKDSVDIILTDVEMPEMDGLELVRRIKRKYPDKICIVMSGNVSYKSTADTLGADGFLTKPFKVNDLFDIVRCYVVGETNRD